MLLILIPSLFSWFAICGPCGATAAPAFPNFGYHRSQGQWVSKRYFGYSSGWGPGGVSVAQGADSSSRANSPATFMVDRLADQYSRDGRISHCAGCQRALETIKADLEKLNLREMGAEELAKLENKLRELLEAIKRWEEAKANARSKRSIFPQLVSQEEIYRIRLSKRALSNL